MDCHASSHLEWPTQRGLRKELLALNYVRKLVQVSKNQLHNFQALTDETHEINVRCELFDLADNLSLSSHDSIAGLRSAENWARADNSSSPSTSEILPTHRYAPCFKNLPIARSSATEKSQSVRDEHQPPLQDRSRSSSQDRTDRRAMAASLPAGQPDARRRSRATRSSRWQGRPSRQ